MNNRSLITITTALCSILSVSLNGMQCPSLSKANWTGSGVMAEVEWPEKPGNNYVLLGREASGSDQGTWDVFGGKRDKGEKHPVVTASREFAEETVYTGMDETKARTHIDVDSGNTKVVIVKEDLQYGDSVTYVSKFDPDTMKKIRNNFYAARNAAKKHHLKEKDAIAWVREDRLKDAIKNSSSNHNVKVLGDIIDSQNPHKSTRTQLTLRPFFVKQIRPWVEGKSYVQGKNSKIHFYK